MVVVVSRYRNQWILVRHKERLTWEVPAGHREPQETLEAAACRELYEETGAAEFELYPVGVYGVVMTYPHIQPVLFQKVIDYLQGWRIYRGKANPH